LGGRAGEGPRIVFFGEHQSPQCKLVSDALVAALKEHPQARLEFRHYPLSKRGNPLRAEIKVDAYPLSFDMALLAQAAGRVGGRGAFWKMHRWLLEHQATLTPQSAQQAASELQLDPQKLIAELQNPQTAAAIRADLQVAAELGVRQAPMVAIEGRPVDGLISNPEIIERILDELAAEK
jgi:protein-disulfide isomerase